MEDTIIQRARMGDQQAFQQLKAQHQLFSPTLASQGKV